ncbi:hypothetical protein [Geothrix sp.]|uniref:hypothetical protein n=1 Tax=Geothrix sp. TaxID=1962974 RepID=UPI0025C55E2A|nr:hypothetical protein [Geothrix sp.]
MLKEVMAYLMACNLGTVIRNSVGMVMAGHRRPVRFGTPGQADITVELHGDPRAVHVECKAQGGKLSDKQVAWLEDQRRRGNVCIVAFSVQDVYQGLTDAGFKVPMPSLRGAA